MTVADPFRVEGSACVSVSGGRSSGLMLHRILEAHGGTLPADVHCVFANTGEEAEGTLVFVREMARRWNVPIRWVEFTTARVPGLPADFSHWREVDYCSASRAGEPFDAMIDWKKYLPNQTQKLCTEWLKVRAIGGLMSSLGYTPSEPATKENPYKPGDYDQVIGIRHDEPFRVAKNSWQSDVILPLDSARIVRGDVAAFWSAQPFDLKIPPGEGNCKTCFGKREEQLVNVIRDSPDGAGVDRMIAREDRIGIPIRKGRPFRVTAARARGQLPMWEPAMTEDVDMRPCACGD